MQIQENSSELSKENLGWNFQQPQKYKTERLKI